MKQQKSYDELQFKDEFMFDAVMENKEICKAIIEEILDVKIKDIVRISTEETIKNGYESKGIRLDVYLEDDENTIYSIEMQVANAGNIPKRSRYYHIAIGDNILDAGKTYDELNKTYVIFICDFDLFGQGLYKYTFENRAEENLDLKLGDGAITIFLNTKGTKGNVSKNLKDLLSYINDPSNIPSNPLVEHVETEVEKLKVSSKLRRDYMIQAIKMMDKYNEGKSDGKNEGKIEGKAEIIAKFLKKMEPEEVAEVLEMSIEEMYEIVKVNGVKE